MIDQLSDIYSMFVGRRGSQIEKDVNFLSWSDAIAWAIKEAVGRSDGEAVSWLREKCEICGRPMRREANCVVCDLCGESKCG